MNDMDGWALEVKIMNIATRLNVLPLMDRAVATLSGGEKKRVGLGHRYYTYPRRGSSLSDATHFRR